MKEKVTKRNINNLCFQWGKMSQGETSPMGRNGITLISLVVTIIVIFIIAGVSISVGTDVIQNSMITKFNSELKIIHAKVNEIAEEKRNQEELDSLGQEIPTLSSIVQSKINTAMQGASTDGFRFFNKSNLEDIGISDIDRAVLINFNTREVVDINGVKKDGNYIYRLEGWNNIAYQDKNTEAPEFSLVKKVYGLTATVQITDIVYKGNVAKGNISYCLYNNETEGTWKNISGEEFTVQQSGIYKVRLTDAAGNIAEQTAEVVLTNKPKLDSGMTPVVYDEALGKWKKVDENSGDWYDYASDKKMWANVMLQDELVVNSDGTIDEENMGSMFVWIPRYMYQIESGYHPSASTELLLEGSINIKFLKGTTSLASDGSNVEISTTSGQGNWLVHPAFTANTDMGGGDKEVTGFWVAKFEASSDTTTAINPNTGASYGRTSNKIDNVRVVPNVTSWRQINVISIYKVCKKMNQTGNAYGLTLTSNPHMMKNSEWGAIAYLTQSEYGNPQTKSDNTSGVWSNSYYEGDLVVNTSASSVSIYSTTMTGMVGSSRNEGKTNYAKATNEVDKSNSETITITYQEYNANGTEKTETAPYTRTYYRYQTTEGQKGSSTRNIYGIYDLAGGAWEYVAGYLEGTSATNANGTESYVEYFKKLAASEKQEYAGEGSTSDAQDRKDNYQANSDKYGDAIWETSRADAGASNSLSWNSDNAYFPFLSSSFFMRGGGHTGGAGAGVFAFYDAQGSAYISGGFRPVVGV